MTRGRSDNEPDHLPARFFDAALAAAVPPVAARSASPGAKRFVAGTRLLEVNGRQARVFGMIGPSGPSGIPSDQANMSIP